MRKAYVFAVQVVLLVTELRSAQPAKLPCILIPLPSTNYPVTPHDEAVKSNTLNLVKVNSEVEFGSVVEFVSRAFCNDNIRKCECRDVIAVVGDLDTKTASTISKVDRSVTLVSAVAPSPFRPATNLVLPNLLYMNSLTYYVEALVALFDHLKWTRIGLICDDTPYYKFAAELVQQKLLENSDRRIVPFVRISERHNTTKTVQTFSEYKTDVIVISTREDIACSLTQEAKRLDFTWPEYAWVLFDFGLPKTCQEEGVILIRDDCMLAKSNHERCNYNIDKLLNSSSFLDFIFAVSSSGGNFLVNGSLSGVDTGQLRFREGKRLINISILQMNGPGSGEEIALYIAESQILVNVSVATDRPRGAILKVYFRDNGYALRIAVVMTLFTFLLIFVTTIFFLYVYFRKEPEVRATSVTVSLSMFLGCYILISYLLLLVIDPAGSVHCHFLVWLSLFGTPLHLITATLFVKMVRVYLIFCDRYSYKKKLCTDPLLFLYILLLVLPTLILLAWSSLDPFKLIQQESPQENYIFIYGRCLSKYTINWVTANLIYYYLLSIALTCLALKTSEIRYKHFKDTKATNAFAYLTCFVATLTIIYWYFFRLQRLTANVLLTTGGILHVGHSIVTVLCQLLLFVPKVYPPLKRALTRNQMKSKN